MIGTVDNPGLAGKIAMGDWYSHDKLQQIGMDIIIRAKFVCAKCGFQSRPSKQIPHGYMVPVDLRHPGLAALEARLGLCFCPLCVSAVAINWSVVQQHSNHGEIVPAAGELIWLPEISQEKINRAASYAISTLSSGASDSQLYGAAFDTDAAFRARRAHLPSNLSLYKNDEDGEFAKALSWLPKELYEHRNEILEGVRFWPTAAQWRKQAAYWYAGVFKPLLKE